MKKTYQLNVENKKTERVAESIQREAKKYIARERRKELPEGVDFWDFDCRIGKNAEVAETVHLSKVSEMISTIAATETESLYLEILVKTANRGTKNNKD